MRTVVISGIYKPGRTDGFFFCELFVHATNIAAQDICNYRMINRMVYDGSAVDIAALKR